MADKKEYIERGALIEFVKQNTPNIDGDTTMQCVERSMRAAPAADVVEVRHGEWVENEDDFWILCSSCGVELWDELEDKKTPYCPHCGAKMDGERKDIP